MRFGIPFQELFTRDSVHVSESDGGNNAVFKVAIDCGPAESQEGLDFTREEMRFIGECAHDLQSSQISRQG